MPAEWEPHRATWLAWPSHAELWGEDLRAARAEFIELCRGIAGAAPTGGATPTRGSAASATGDGTNRDSTTAGAPQSPQSSRDETLEVLVLDETGEREASEALLGLRVRFHRVPFGDIWLRDTAPTFVQADDGTLEALCFRFNGWGGKYDLPGDREVGERIAGLAGWPSRLVDLVAEGGAIEVDGEGTCMTTRQCLLDANRNPGVAAADVAHLLQDALGVRRVIWLERGLRNDHTDGHVDTLARFVAPGVVAVMEARTGEDPNGDVLREVRNVLSCARDARGRKLELVAVPSPGAVCGRDGDLLPASYLNFYIANWAVLVPVYGSAYDDEAVQALESCFSDRPVRAVGARAVLTGGGALHCITQQEPLPMGHVREE